uniref:Amino acid transporter transmembrane domain-containing protein n=1 Tax=Attheya septentrionalis TaxID=420275 RepID=A0A7S2XQC9_9STRA|mmetsp:Transcript_26789/g.48659  ORF Transcript_26789/g.48659 Transcript_26789/m.48659 type:complete len:519 (+) Transcript_26789:183-1739(+)
MAEHDTLTATSTNAARRLSFSSTGQSNGRDNALEGHGSSVGEAIFNVTNGIVGAGAIGLGGAIASSGGLISVFFIIVFAVMNKLSLDIIITLTVQTEGAKGSYEQLGWIAYGFAGKAAVLLSKSLYSFGCLVAYIIVIRDNFGSGTRNLIFGGDTHSPPSEFVAWSLSTGEQHISRLELFLEHDGFLTFVLSATIILPLCLLRDMTPLARFSVVSVLSMVAIVLIVIGIYVMNPGGDTREAGGTIFEKWFEVRSGLLESLGTFVFAFVSQNTAHLAYESLDPAVRSVKSWKLISLCAVSISAMVSLSVGVCVYMTFWEHTESDIFQIYPSSNAIDAAKILLCITMMLTFPLPFFTTREMIILVLSGNGRSGEEMSVDEETPDLKISLLAEEFGSGEEAITETDPFGEEADVIVVESQKSWLLPGEERQLSLPFHVLLTILLWATTTVLAIVAPSLGDVLDLVGCASGAVIALILPALFSLKLTGYSHLAAFILTIGGVVGVIGTFFSVKKLVTDLETP